MTRLLMAATAIVLCVPTAFAADALPEGNWRFSEAPSATFERPLALLKVEKKDEKLSISLIEAAPKFSIKVSDLKIDGKSVTFIAEIGSTKYTFDGLIDPKNAKVVRGTLGEGTRFFRSSLNAQDGDTIEQPKPPKMPDEFMQAGKLNAAVALLRGNAQRSKDANDKAELLAKAKDAQKEADEKVPGLYREFLTKNADSPYAAAAANSLLRMAGKVKPKADEVATWVKIVEAEAASYGAKIERDATFQVGEILAAQKDVAAMALPLAEKVAANVKDTDPLASQSRALKLLATAEKAAGKTNAATETRLAKIEKALDDEYVKKVPPFKPEKFAGRKDKETNRVAVFELFTGATCPPCVAADAAFDALELAYEPKDLVLIQYHMHIPAPDTLTNPATIARWDYYSKLNPGKIGGVPSSLFNGTPQAGGGGGMANAENKFNQYRKIIDDLVEAKSEFKITGSAKRTGDKIAIKAVVDGTAESGADIKVRLLLVEEKVKYAGSNGMRFHHKVVRAMPASGSAGTPLAAKSTEIGTTFDLAELRKDLNKYLDDFSAERAFPNPDRPMELAHLAIIALVQDDKTGEILNAAEIPVEGK